MFRNIADTDCYTERKVRCNCRPCKTNKTDFFSFLNVITKPMKIKQKAWMFHAPSIKHPFHTAQSRINPQLWVGAYSIFVVKHPRVPAPKQIPNTTLPWGETPNTTTRACRQPWGRLSPWQAVEQEPFWVPGQKTSCTETWQRYPLTRAPQ